MLKLGLIGTGYVILGPNGEVSRSDDDVSLPASPFTRPWAAPLPVPAEPIPVPPFADCVTVDPVTGKRQYHCVPEYTRFVDNDTTFFEIVAEERWVKFHPDLPYTSIWGYRDVNQPVETASILGPTFKARYGPFLDGDGKPKLAGGVYVRHHNQLPLNHTGFGVTRLTVHHHGGHHFSRADGFPDNNDAFADPVVYENDREPRFYDYLMPLLDPGFVVDKDAGVPHTDSGETPSTLWYHDHILDFTGQNAYRGLAGFFLAFDDGALKSVVNKSVNKVYIIQQVDKKIPLETIAKNKDLRMDALLEDMETIAGSGTKLNLNYAVDEMLDEYEQEEIVEYFKSCETSSLQLAQQELSEGNFTWEQLKIMRIKFLSEYGM